MIQRPITHVSEVVRKLCGELARGRTRDRVRSTQPLQTTIETRVTSNHRILYQGRDSQGENFFWKTCWNGILFFRYVWTTPISSFSQFNKSQQIFQQIFQQVFFFLWITPLLYTLYKTKLSIQVVCSYLHFVSNQMWELYPRWTVLRSGLCVVRSRCEGGSASHPIILLFLSVSSKEFHSCTDPSAFAAAGAGGNSFCLSSKTLCRVGTI